MEKEEVRKIREIVFFLFKTVFNGDTLVLIQKRRNDNTGGLC